MLGVFGDVCTSVTWGKRISSSMLAGLKRPPLELSLGVRVSLKCLLTLVLFIKLLNSAYYVTDE